MAQHQLDIQLGQDKTTLTASAGASIGASAVRITIDDANVTSKAQAMALIDVIEQYIVQGVWPPTP